MDAGAAPAGAGAPESADIVAQFRDFAGCTEERARQVLDDHNNLEAVRRSRLRGRMVQGECARLDAPSSPAPPRPPQLSAAVARVSRTGP